MNLLLDTNVLLWWLTGSSRLKADARATIVASPLVYVSAASTWEIEIKRAIGKLEAPDDLQEAMIANQFLTQPITVAHSIAAARLPRHHDDPFDRMLIAQAKLENFMLLTSDRRLKSYDVKLQII